jgi:serine/threonine protein kinase
MEFADDGDLLQRIKKHKTEDKLIPEDQIMSIFIQVVSGLNRIHQLNIMHRDLKSANVFLNKDGRAQLGDLNVSKLAQLGLNYTQTGTPYYASPEVWKEKPYGFKSDIWSLGCVLYEMASLKPPFKAKNMNELYKKVAKGLYSPIPSMYSKTLSKIIGSLLRKNPSNRPGADEILKTLIMGQSKLQDQSMHFDLEGMKPIDSSQTSQEVVTSSNLEMILTKYSKNKTTSTEDTLLDTILVPQNGKLKQIATKLPKSNYLACSTEGNTSKNEFSHGLHFSRNSINVVPNSNNKSMIVEMKEYNSQMK